MAEYSYGVVVEKNASDFNIWLLFRSAKSCLMSLDAELCRDPLRIGDIVQAKTVGTETRIRRCWPFPDSLWYDGTRLVIRTIVSYSREVTIGRGKWNDERSGVVCALLLSRDVGPVTATVQWYNHELSEAGECHHFAYVEYLPRTFVNVQTKERVEFCWTVIGDRISLPAVPSKDEDAARFLEPAELRRVPALTLHRLGNSMLMWSYALGDRVAISRDDEKTKIGEWMTVTIIPSSDRDFAKHGCQYTILRHETAKPYSQPEIKIDKNRITMTLTLNRSESDEGGVRLWHDFWGLAVGYDEAHSEWIRRGEKGQFRAEVEVSMISEQLDDGRRVSIKAVGTTAQWRAGHLRRSHSSSHAFEDLGSLKAALQRADSNNNNNNNGNLRADQTTSDTTVDDETWKQAMIDKEIEKETKYTQMLPKWDDDPKKELKSASIRGSTESGLHQRNWAREEEELRRQKRQFRRGGWSCGSPGGFNEVAKFADCPKAPAAQPKSGFASTNIVGPVPIRAFDDKSTERRWRAEMTKRGWHFPPENMPANHLLTKRIISLDRMKTMVAQCLITRICYFYDPAMKDPHQIELWVLSGTPAYIVHTMWKQKYSSIRNRPECMTVGNVVELSIRRTFEGYAVGDDNWRLVTRLQMPMREVVFEPARTKTLELIVTGKCLSQEAQNRHNDRHRYNKQGFTMLTNDILLCLIYHGKDIDVSEHDDYDYQMVVVPEECLAKHGFWKVTEVLWRVTKELASDPVMPHRLLEVEAVPREMGLIELLEFFDKLMENDELMQSLFERTGTDYRKKFFEAKDVLRQPMQRTCRKRETECCANYLIGIEENAYSQEIFRAAGEKRLYKMLVKVCAVIRAWRGTVNNR